MVDQHIPGWNPGVSASHRPGLDSDCRACPVEQQITNGIILCRYSHQSSGNWWTYTATNKVFPIWAAWWPDLVLETGGWDDFEVRGCGWDIGAGAERLSRGRRCGRGDAFGPDQLQL